MGSLHARMRRLFIYIYGAICFTDHRTSPESRPRSRAMSPASSTKSPTRKSARLLPMMTSGSSATRSVHWRGTEQTVSSSTLSNSRAPDRLYRSPTHRSCCPCRGWNGCVTRTRRVAVTQASAFRVELQAALQRPLPALAAARRFARPACPAGPRAAGIAHGRGSGIGQGRADVAGAADGGVNAQEVLANSSW